MVQLSKFTRRFFSFISLDELSNRRLADIAAYTIDLWQKFYQYDEEAFVKVFNFSYEQNGWQSAYTTIQIFHKDQPFLIDSIRMELNRRVWNSNFTNTVISSLRVNSKVSEIIDDNADKCKMESVVFIELDRCLTSKDQFSLEDSLYEVLNEARTAVSDYALMQSKAQDILVMLKSLCVEHEASENINEVYEFVRWLLNNHFTFLGYEEFTIKSESKKNILSMIRNHY